MQHHQDSQYQKAKAERKSNELTTLLFHVNLDGATPANNDCGQAISWQFHLLLHRSVNRVKLLIRNLPFINLDFQVII